MGSFSLVHWLVVAFVAALVFGPKRLGSIGKELGTGIRGFRDAITGKDEEKDDEDDEEVSEAPKKRRLRSSQQSQES